MRFGILRLSASWREIERYGYEHLDWLLTTAERARQPVLLTVGMKALGWPEFYLPEGLSPSDAPEQVVLFRRKQAAHEQVSVFLELIQVLLLDH